jgi:glutaredoxin-like protein NrdH
VPRIITLYTSPGCQPCKAIKRWFAKEGVEYTEKDVTKDPLDLAAVKELGYKSAPVVIVSTGDPEIEIHWQGLHMANLKKYTLTTTKEAA